MGVIETTKTSPVEMSATIKKTAEEAYFGKRHRVAEYPAEKPLEANAGSNLPSSITLEIQQDRFTKIAEESWIQTGGKLPEKPFDPEVVKEIYVNEVVVSSFEKQLFQKEAINALPLYPNEQIMWDESVIPSINYSGEGCLALPKLNLQFLTLHDYLLRNFNLFPLESTYEIREDIQEAVPHLLAHINNEGETAFLGWSQMAVPMNDFEIPQVKQPNIGEEKPSSVTSVTAEVTFSIKSYRTQIRSEWTHYCKINCNLYILTCQIKYT